ncbi:MAG: hypothetical protein ABL997_05755 [Planctomycetota bacterium]
MAIAKKTRSKSEKSLAKSKTSTKTTEDGGSPTALGGDVNDDDGSGRSSSMGLDVDHEVLEFIAALDRFKKSHNRAFPNWSEVLFVLKELGYRKK